MKDDNDKKYDYIDSDPFASIMIKAYYYVHIKLSPGFVE